MHREGGLGTEVSYKLKYRRQQFNITLRIVVWDYHVPHKVGITILH